MTTEPEMVQQARTALACLDLTSLNDGDTEADIAALCEKARSPMGWPAAVCVWPRLAAFARSQLPAQVGVAAVANFPEGHTDIDAAVRDTWTIVEAGADEVDVVLPWRALQAGGAQDTHGARLCAQLLQAVRRACEGRVLKVILESGNLASPGLIQQASELALDAGADFLKTSTGKSGTGATPEAARVMLGVIAQRSRPGQSVAGFKASGGVRKVSDAAVYIALVQAQLGVTDVTPRHLRIGASGLLDDILAVGHSSSNPSTLDGRTGSNPHAY
jgi:deoxyribose-phosphate aldolase